MGRLYECRGCKVRHRAPWKGPCGNCNRWYNWREVPEDDGKAFDGPIAENTVVPLCDVKPPARDHTPSGMPQTDRVFGVHPADDKMIGICIDEGQIVQIYGDPGGGKSTLLLQLCRAYANKRIDVLYIAGEESVTQISGNAARIGKFRANMQIVEATDLDDILDHIEERRPKVCVIDSIQTVRVEDFRPGSTAAVTEAIHELKRAAKKERFALFVVVQVGKDLDFSGPKSLEHLVDTSVHLQGIEDRPRRLRPHKNRFGGFAFAHYRMTGAGLVEYEPERDRDDAEDDDPPSRPAPVSTPDNDAPAPHRPVLAIVPPPAEPVDRVTLETDCDEPDCRGQDGRACTASDGTREAGFHSSRIAKARTGARKMPPEEPRDPEPPPDPFGGGPLKGKPRIRGRRPAV